MSQTLNALLPQRGWILSLLLTIGLFYAAQDGLERYATTLEVQLANLQQQDEQARQQWQQWQDDARSAQQLRETLSNEDTDRLLAPTGRQLLAARLDALAQAQHFSSLAYEIGAFTPWDGQPDFPGITGIARAPLTLEADAPTDTDVLAFLAATPSLPGKLKLRAITLRALRDDKPDAATPLNVHVKAQFEWLANMPQEANAQGDPTP